MVRKAETAFPLWPSDGPTTQVTGLLLARSSLYNLLGQVLPLLVALVAIPYVVRGLGPERFGLLSLAWVVLGYFTLFDLGLGRATTKYVAELVGRGEEQRVPEVLWTALAFQLILGLLGAAVLFLVTPFLVERVLHVPPELAAEARRAFTALSLGVPVVLVSSSLLGALEGRQRFDLVNAVRIPASAGTYLLPALGVALQADLAHIVLLIIAWRAAAATILLWVNWRTAETFRATWPNRALARQLIGFGAWVAVSGVVGPVLVYLERFVLATLTSVAALGYYVAPYEAVTRLWVVPASLATTLFPVFSQLGTSRSLEAAGDLMLRAIRILASLLAPVVLVLVVFSWEIIALWLGPEFAAHSAAVLQILAVGVLVNSLANVPYALVQASGRPDLTAKFHLLELPLHLAATAVLVSRFGVVGAAWAWTLRVSLDAALLTWAALRLTSPPGARSAGGRAAVTAAVFVSIVVAAGYLKEQLLPGRALLAEAGAAALLLASGYVLAGLLLLDAIDRRMMRQILKRAEART